MSEVGLVSAKITLDYCQHKYVLCFLILLDGHSAKDIFPIILKIRDGNAQPKEQPESNKIWAINQKVKKYG